MTNKIHYWIKTFAKFSGILIALLLIALLFLNIMDGNERHRFIYLTSMDWLSFLFFPLSTITGYIIMWRKAKIGSTIVMLGTLLLVIFRLDLLKSLIPLFVIPALVFAVLEQTNSKSIK